MTMIEWAKSTWKKPTWDQYMSLMIGKCELREIIDTNYDIIVNKYGGL